MKRIVLIFVGIITVLLCAAGFRGRSLAAATPNSQEQHLTAAGSGVNLMITQLLVDAFVKDHPQVAIDIPGSIGTRGAIKAVTDGAITFGLISRPLKEEEKALGLVAKPYAQTAIVIGAHPGVPDQSITSQELIDIFKGTKTQWKDGKEIIVQAREKTDSGFAVLEKNIPGFKEVYQESQDAKRWTLYFTDQEANRALASTPCAIGVTDIGMVATENLRINVLKFNGIEPGLESLRNGTYPLTRVLSFVYREENLPESAKAFLNFVYSDAGQRIMASKNYLSVQ